MIKIANRTWEIRPSGMKRGLAETWCMAWRLFATKLETAETVEGVALNMRAPYFYPTSTQIKQNL